MFVITSLAAVGLPMLNGFVGEFLILSGGMQASIAHHTGWTVFATTGVIFGASYMLWMIQRVFYGSLGLRPEEVQGWDLSPREHARAVALRHALPRDGPPLAGLDARHRYLRRTLRARLPGWQSDAESGRLCDLQPSSRSLKEAR